MEEDKRKKLVLLDSHAILHRAFHAIPNFTSPQGEPTGALYGFAAFLLKIIREIKPDYITACYDLPEPTFRHVSYKEYKGKRPKIDDSLISQINNSHKILDIFGVPSYSKGGFEADDILGTIVEQLKEDVSKIKIIIASGDLDTLQLVKDDDVVVYTPSKGVRAAVIYNEEKVKERFGFNPDQLPDYKALKGDPSDNIIGVRGVGDKSATDIIKKFERIEKLYKIIKEDKKKVEDAGIKPRIVNLLEENEEEALFSKTLAEIRKDVPINFELEGSEWKKSFDRENVKKMFNQWGFSSLVDRLP